MPEFEVEIKFKITVSAEDQNAAENLALDAWDDAACQMLDQPEVLALETTLAPNQPKGIKVDLRGYFRPNNAGLSSVAVAAGRRIARILRALEEDVNQCICSGPILEDLRGLKMKIIDRLTKDGWRVYRSMSDRWQVLPPKER